MIVTTLRILRYFLIFMLFYIFGTILANKALAKTVRIGIMDSGLNVGERTNLCKRGHFDFNTNESVVGYDALGHGTSVKKILQDSLKIDNYYFVIITANIFHVSFEGPLKHLTGIKLDALNISMTGSEFNYKEFSLLNKILKRAVVFVAAGNDGRNLNKYCYFYPQCYPIKSENFFIVGALRRQWHEERYSNYGNIVRVWENGRYGRREGTSFASPRALARYLNQRYGK